MYTRPVLSQLGRTVHCVFHSFSTIMAPIASKAAPYTVVQTDDECAVKLAIDLLAGGQVIALPTDTVYGFSCDANNPKAMNRLYEIKGRDGMKPVAICVADLTHLRHWGKADHLPNEMLNHLLPGPVTLVLDKTEHLDNPALNPGTHKIGIRIPDFEFIRSVTRKFKCPVALSSANPSSAPSTLQVSEFKKLWSQLGAVFDGGRLGITESQRAASTVIDLSSPGLCRVIRDGVAINQTIEIVKKFGLRVE